jgi:tetratricopeptide (TPR) repeat protein
LWHSQNRLESAYRQAIELDPYSGNVALGSLLGKLGQYEEAANAYRQAIQVDSENATTYLALGALLEHQGKLEEAEEVYRQIVIRNDWDCAYLGTVILGSFFEQNQQYDEAEALYRQLVNRYPVVADPYKILGEFFERRELYDEAEEVYRQLVKVSTQNYPLYEEVPRSELARSSVHYSHYILGDFLKRYERYSEAEAVYRQLIQYYPDNAAAYLLLGDVLEQQGYDMEAQEAYRQAADLDPSLPFP